MEGALSLEGIFIKTRNQEGKTSIRSPLFNETNLIFWKVRIRYYLQSLGENVWGIIEGCLQYAFSIPTNEAEKNNYDTNAKVFNALFGRLAES